MCGGGDKPKPKPAPVALPPPVVEDEAPEVSIGNTEEGSKKRKRLSRSDLKTKASGGQAKSGLGV